MGKLMGHQKKCNIFLKNYLLIFFQKIIVHQQGMHGKSQLKGRLESV